MKINENIGIMKKRTTLESTFERKFCDYLKRFGIMTLKINGPGKRDWPDRLVMFPNGLHCFVEVKRKGEVPTPKQWIMIDKLNRQQQPAMYIDRMEGIHYLLQLFI